MILAGSVTKRCLLPDDKDAFLAVGGLGRSGWVGTGGSVTQGSLR